MAVRRLTKSFWKAGPTMTRNLPACLRLWRKCDPCGVVNHKNIRKRLENISGFLRIKPYFYINTFPLPCISRYQAPRNSLSFLNYSGAVLSRMRSQENEKHLEISGNGGAACPDPIHPNARRSGARVRQCLPARPPDAPPAPGGGVATR